jgi:hypothetical protein
MKKCCALLLLAILPAITFSMCSTHKITDLITQDFRQEDRKSFDEMFDEYDPCTLILKNGFFKIVAFCKETYGQVELLNRALNSSKIKEKQG